LQIKSRPSSTSPSANRFGATICPLVDRAEIAVFFPDAERIPVVREVKGYEVIARSRQLALVLAGLAQHVKLRALAVELSQIDDKAPLVDAKLRDEKHAIYVASVVGAHPIAAGFEAQYLYGEEVELGMCFVAQTP
jgi:hypothetical protein